MVSDKNLLITFMFSANMWKIDAIISMKNDFVVLETSAHIKTLISAAIQFQSSKKIFYFFQVRFCHRNHRSKWPHAFGKIVNGGTQFIL